MNKAGVLLIPSMYFAMTDLSLNPNTYEPFPQVLLPGKAC